MKQIKVYKYKLNNDFIFSQEKPSNCEFEEYFYIEAEKNNYLTNGFIQIFGTYIKEEDLSLWKEKKENNINYKKNKYNQVQKKEENNDNDSTNYKQLLDIITGEKEEEI